MWLYDIHYNIYSSELSRKIYIVKTQGDDYDEFTGNNRASKRRHNTDLFTVVEEWYTPESKGNTGDFNYYTFGTYLEAETFIISLAMRLNTPWQNAAAQAAEQFVTKITKEFGKAYKQTKRLIEEKSEAKKDTCVYVFDMGNNSVKIGISRQVEKRLKTISFSSGLSINRYSFTKPVTKRQARKIESLCHEHFSEHRKKGEFFSIPYETACNYLKIKTTEVLLTT